jgi:phosphoribosylformimino-5-aminoimidazole carboxamide ribotide isomerase
VIVVPAIDIRRGRVVRLTQGRAENETVYGDAPADVARRWEQEGAVRLHVVDLDAAIDGLPQTEAVGAVIRAVRVPVEVGGGIRSVEDAARYVDLGAERVIFGTAAISRPEDVQAAVSRWAQAVAVAIDARDGKVAVQGWNEVTGTDALELAATVEGWGSCACSSPTRGGTARSSGRTSRRSRRWGAARDCASRRPAESRTRPTSCVCARSRPTASTR